MTQKQKIIKAFKKGQPESIVSLMEKTNILRPNIRRILGTGAKIGHFHRIAKGVYVLKVGEKTCAYVETGDAVKVLPRLAQEGFKADMVFLDIPYKTNALAYSLGQHKPIRFDFITPKQFETVIAAVSQIVRDEDTPVIYMYSQAVSGIKQMEKYNAVICQKFIPVASGEYIKLTKDGRRHKNIRGQVIYPEKIILLTKSGRFDQDVAFDFQLVRPIGYQTEKPAAMLKRMIEMTTEAGETVLDPFAGSGVCVAESVKLNRFCYAIEKSVKAVQQFIKPRLLNMEGGLAG